MVDIRQPGEEELRAAMEATTGASGSSLEEADWERERESVPLDRSIAAFVDGRPVGFAAWYEFELTIPGGQLPAAGVTWVGVLPSHRRRGVLREFMRRQLDDGRQRGEPMAVLWASEAAIYGRFGYGIAAPNAHMKGDRSRFAFRDDPGPQGQVRFVDEQEAFALFPPVYDRLRAERPGMFTRSEHWWRKHRLADYPHHRRDASQRFYAAVELDDEVAAYAVYRVRSEWEGGFPQGEVRIIEAFAVSAPAARELWRFLFGIDLTTRVESTIFDLASPLFLMVVDPRALNLRVWDGLWLRLVDVETALRSRSYAGDDAVVLDVRDDLCPWNAGRYRVGGEVARTDDEPDLALDVADLGSAYLGGFDFHRLAAAGRARELRPGALERASALFRTPLPPFCPEVF